MTNECLFIGGPADKEMKRIDSKQDYVQVPEYPELGERMMSGDEEVIRKTHTYHMLPFMWSKTNAKHRVFIHESLWGLDIMQLLIESYANQPKPVQDEAEIEAVAAIIIEALTHSNIIRAAHTDNDGKSVIIWDGDSLRKLKEALRLSANRVIDYMTSIIMGLSK